MSVLTNKEIWRTWPIPDTPVDLWDWQDGRCAWCGTDRSDRFVTDHCHMTGLVRGLLCGRCNTVEGHSTNGDWDAWRDGDNPANAIKHFEIYVSSFRGTPYSPQSALHYYSHAERVAWWRQIVSDLAEGARWPEDAPWTAEAQARKDAVDAQLRAAMSDWTFLTPGAAS